MLVKRKAMIVVTNDDGIDAPGLKALAAGVRDLGDVWIVAPDRPQSAVGRAMTLHKPLRLHRLGRRKYSVNGTPADCVTLAVGKLLCENRPALVLSGINHGLNLGDDVTNSGTVAAAMEGLLHGVPSVAISQDNQGPSRYTAAARFACDLAAMVLAQGLPDDTMLNVNIPSGTSANIRGVRFTSLSRRYYRDPIVEKTDPRGERYYWLAGERESLERNADSDFVAIDEGMVSVTPLHLDLTQYDAFPILQRWERALNPMRSTSSRGRRNRPAKQTARTPNRSTV